ncbi:unnamed protein product [Bursaphelenchus okinawaensis]|uniref:Uncharacterized protein n=1 Tax=Bursaphelenchus okinawaensis TaxID=465554 RepID=A0A811JUE4_9BILA|nr:unnamed protein product [Bursaphelenchus okinawaensis]CAG9082924.1 unnamed protein product [Bursaphelenchus okinawaensis]
MIKESPVGRIHFWSTNAELCHFEVLIARRQSFSMTRLYDLVDLQWLEALIVTNLAICFIFIHTSIQCCKKSTPAAKPSLILPPTSASSPASPAALPAANATDPPGPAGDKPAAAAENPTQSPAVKEQEMKSMQTQQSSKKSASKKSEKSKKSKSQKEKERSTEDKKEDKDDSFERRKPKVKEAGRAEEIRERGAVPRERDDYKTMKAGMPTSDFDKSLNLPQDNKKDVFV